MIDFTANLYLADCAARSLAEQRPRRGGSRYLREYAVKALRFLWQSGNAEAKRTVAARILVWLEIPDDRRQRVCHRITQGGVR